MGLVVVSGANRGIGLEFCRQYKELGLEVVGLCRGLSPELVDLGVEVHHDINLVNAVSFRKVQDIFRGRTIDLLINNAGMLTVESVDAFNSEQVMAQIALNSVAPLQLTLALISSLQRGSKVAMISSVMGSIAENESGGYYGYRMSKAALNAGAVSLARDLSEREIHVGIYHPGYVKTAMTGYAGEIEPAVAVRGLRQIIDALNGKNSGVFYHSNGRIIPW